mmetsp:Transcript_27117/g.84351  ORF Transcript_27117/g.84351 Transcript_27117/m.84351 type:complete len:470 (+) Transcript_27117:1324-2733(+)
MDRSAARIRRPMGRQIGRSAGRPAGRPTDRSVDPLDGGSWLPICPSIGQRLLPPKGERRAAPRDRLHAPLWRRRRRRLRLALESVLAREDPDVPGKQFCVGHVLPGVVRVRAPELEPRHAHGGALLVVPPDALLHRLREVGGLVQVRFLQPTLLEPLLQRPLVLVDLPRHHLIICHQSRSPAHLLPKFVVFAHRKAVHGLALLHSEHVLHLRVPRVRVVSSPARLIQGARRLQAGIGGALLPRARLLQRLLRVPLLGRGRGGLRQPILPEVFRRAVHAIRQVATYGVIVGVVVELLALLVQGVPEGAACNLQFPVVFLVAARDRPAPIAVFVALAALVVVAAQRWVVSKDAPLPDNAVALSRRRRRGLLLLLLDAERRRGGGRKDAEGSRRRRGGPLGTCRVGRRRLLELLLLQGLERRRDARPPGLPRVGVLLAIRAAEDVVAAPELAPGERVGGAPQLSEHCRPRAV